MAESQQKDIAFLRQCVNGITTSKVKEREHLLTQVIIPRIECADLPEVIAHELCELIMLTISRYKIRNSRLHVEAVIAALGKYHGKYVVKYLMPLLQHDAERALNSSSTNPAWCSDSVTMLSWLCILQSQLFTSPETFTSKAWTDLVLIQCQLVHCIFACKSSKLINVAVKHLNKNLEQNHNLSSKYLEAISKLGAEQYLLCMVGVVVKHLTAADEVNAISNYKDQLFDLYTKTVISCKIAPFKHVLIWSSYLLCQLDHATFKNMIFPAAQKALLRNPEISTTSLVYILDAVKIDLSQYLMTFAKSAASGLRSSRQETCQETSRMIKHFIRQCTDSNSVKSFLNYLLSVLKGSEGKLTSWTQRVSVTEGIRSVHHLGISGSSRKEELALYVCEQLIDIAKQDTHEASLVNMISVIGTWSSGISTAIPKFYLDFLKNGITNKTLTPAVRTAYLKCLSNSFKSDSDFADASILVKSILEIFQRSASQTNVQSAMIEGLASAVALCKCNHALRNVNADTVSDLSSFWSNVLDSQKRLFTSTKFLSSCTEEDLILLLEFIEGICTNHASKLNPDSIRPLMDAVVYALTHETWSIRKLAINILSNLQSITIDKFHCNDELLQSYRERHASFLCIEVSKSVDENKNRIKAGKVLAFALKAISTIPLDQQQDKKLCEKMALKILIDAHDPLIANIDTQLWLKLVRRNGLQAKDCVKDHLGDFMAAILNDKESKQAIINAVETLCDVIGNEFVTEIIHRVIDKLSNDALLSITDEEYGIYLCPEGELYDKNLIMRLTAESKTQNVKRESKAYSYEEQMLDEQLRQELKKKKGDSTSLGEKQQEIVKLKLMKESEIRQNLKALFISIERYSAMLEVITRSNPASLQPHLSSLMPVLLALLQSPLAAQVAKQLCYCLGFCAFIDREDRLLADTVTSCIVRIMHRNVMADGEWDNIEIASHVHIAIKRIYQKLCGRSDVNDSDRVMDRLPTYTFSYCFSLFRYIVTKLQRNDKIVKEALQLLRQHSEISLAQDDITNENNAQYLPLADMMSLLMGFIALPCKTKLELDLQGIACASIVQICGTLGDVINNHHNRKVGHEEIDILLMFLTSPLKVTRQVVLKGLLNMLPTLRNLRDPSVSIFSEEEAKMRFNNLLRSIWLLRYDTEENIADLSEQVWKELNLSLEPTVCTSLLDFSIDDDGALRKIAAVAISAAVDEIPNQVDAIIKRVLELFKQKLTSKQPVHHASRLAEELPKDEWQARCGLGLTLQSIAPFLNESQASSIFSFFIPEALGDRSEVVREHMLNAALAIITVHGKDIIGTLLPTLQEYLDNAPRTSAEDAIRQAVVVVMGSLAKHLDSDDPKMQPIIDRLLNTLSTPSQSVQEAVANCLPPLISAVKPMAPSLIKKMLHQLLESQHYGERRGAAYGLAGIVKGLGILSLKQMNVMSALEEAIQDKKNYIHREGAVLALEMLFSLLGRIFEPYIVYILPHLLICFGDGSQYVREATEDAAKLIMRKLSAHGVKLIFPSLLDALKEDSWRTKIGSVELLGAMAHCAPKQLSSCLPSIVPKLIEVLGDSHVKVQNAGLQALQQIASVIKNPEIRDISKNLIDSLSDPTVHASSCLQNLLSTSFVHFIDAPSLALIMPMLHRALQQRSSETKKMACQIIGNMLTLTDMKDLGPYLESVEPGLKQALVDPMPDVRHVSAKALGALVKGMGERQFSNLLPWLLEKLVTDGSTVDRSGAAQGLSEVIYALGIDRLKALLPDIIRTTERKDVAPNVRDGYLMLFIYLPMTFKADFSPFIGSIIPGVLQGLADEAEYVRDTSLRAGQLIISMYSGTAISVFLPQLEAGLFNDNWRIRYSSVQLSGDLLFHLSGVTGKMTTEGKDEENFGTENSMKAIVNALGRARRDRILSGIYICRSDISHTVRQTAIHIWKIVVVKTAKTLREILPTLFVMLIDCLASSNYDKRHMATTSLTDLVTKLGETVLPEIIPILTEGLKADEYVRRQGICIGLGSIIVCTSKEQILQFISTLVTIIREVLCDNLEEVREAAATTFHNLHNRIGNIAFDEILSVLLDEINGDDKDKVNNALNGLRQVVLVKSSTTLPFLVPKLAKSPIQVKALAYVASVAGKELAVYANQVIPSLLNAVKEYTRETEREKEDYDACRTLVVSVMDETTVRIVLEELFELTKSSDVNMRKTALDLLYSFFSETNADYVPELDLILRALVRLLNDQNDDVLHLSWNSLNIISKNTSEVDMIQHIEDLRQAVRFVADDTEGGKLPGVCLPKKGMVPLLTFYREGILKGAPEIKEQAAVGLGEIIGLTSVEALKPSVVNITGPLIRILGDKFNWSVRVAILHTLVILLEKVGVMLKPFVSQLQTTFSKSLNDANRHVREEASKALKLVIKYHARVDLLFNELHSGIKKTEDTAIRVTMLATLSGVSDVVGEKISEKTRKSIIETLLSLLGSSEEEIREEAAKCVGSFCIFVPEEELKEIIHELLANNANIDWVNRHGLAMALTCTLHKAIDRLVKLGMKDEIIAKVTSQACTDRIPICCAGVQSVGCMLRLFSAKHPPDELISALVEALKSKSNDVRIVTMQTIHLISIDNSITIHLTVHAKLVPHLLNNSKEKNTAVKIAAERSLAALLNLKDSNDTYQKCLKVLDSATSSSLMESYKKVLQNVFSQRRYDNINEFTNLLIHK